MKGMNALVKFMGLGILAMLGFILLMAETEDISMLITIKLIGVGLWYLVVKIWPQVYKELKE